jgi:hypothetical protein
VDVLCQGNVRQSLYGEQIWTDILSYYEKNEFEAILLAAGMENNYAARSAAALAGPRTMYIPLFTLLNSVKPLLSVGCWGEFRLRFFFNTLANCVVLQGGDTNPSASLTYTTLYVDILKVSQDHVIKVRNAQKKGPYMGTYLDTRFNKIAMIAGQTTYTNQRMTGGAGRNAAIAFFIRPSNAAGSQYTDAMVNLSTFNIKDAIGKYISFEDLDVPGDYDRFNKMAAEYYQGFGDYYANFPTPYVFGLSWSDEIESERRTGSYHGSTLFIADETITVNLPASLANNSNLCILQLVYTVLLRNVDGSVSHITN